MKWLTILLATLFISCSVSHAGQGFVPFGSAKAYSAANNPPTFRSIVEVVYTTPASQTLTTGTLTIASDDLIVCFSRVGGGYSTSGITCGASNTLTGSAAVVFSTPENMNFKAFYKAGAVGGDSTCTATYSSASATNMTLFCATYSGVATTSALDQTSCSNASCDAFGAYDGNRTAVNVSTTTNVQLLIGAAVERYDSHSYTADNSFTLRTISTGVRYTMLDKVTSASGTYPNGNFATTGADPYVSLFLTFKD